MNTFEIKLVAIITMVIDHIGAFFFPEVLWLRLIGRVSFPLFAWMIANGAEHTRNMDKYLVRVGILALVSQVPVMLLNRMTDPHFSGLNAIFTLFLGLMAINSWNKYRSMTVRLGWIGGACLVAEILKTDYGTAGVLAVVLFYIFRKNKKAMFWSQAGLYLTWYVLPFIYTVLINKVTLISLGRLINPLGLTALIFIFAYTGKQGIKAKYLLYAFYPIHYLVMYLIKLM